MTKIIINVGRQIGSGGHIIAEKLAKDFGCKCYDRELLNLAAKESGFSEKFFEQNDEQKGFFKSLFHTDFSAAVIAAIVMSWYMNKLKKQHQEQLKVNSL